MEFSIHFVFQLFKIAVLSSGYAGLIVAPFFIFDNIKSGRSSYKSSIDKILVWFKTGVVVFVVLFIFMFSDEGNHGLGDSSRIPVGYGKAVHQIDATSFIKVNLLQFEPLFINRYALTNDFLIAEIKFDTSTQGLAKYVIWNLKTDETTFLYGKTAIDSLARTTVLSKSIRFEDFWTHYQHHWNGWRFWLLP